MMRDIPFGRPVLDQSARQAVMDVMSGHTLTHGPHVDAFEQSFAQFTGAANAVAVNSCTAALHLAAMHLDLQPDDEVIVPALTHIASAHAIELCGARCVFADVEPDSGNIDARAIESAMTAKTRAIVVVHFLGVPANMHRICDIASRNDVCVIEDCALSLGGRHNDVHTGLLGDVGCFSFYPIKHITTGEGGMLITRHKSLADDARLRRAFGIDRNRPELRSSPGAYDVTALGNNYRMNEMAAAMGCSQMHDLPNFLQARRNNAHRLTDGLRDLGNVRFVGLGSSDFESAHYCLNMVLADSIAHRRDDFIKALKFAGVGTSIYYPRPVPFMAYYARRYGDSAAYPVASRLCASTISLPVGPHLGDEDIDYIVDAVRSIVGPYED